MTAKLGELDADKVTLLDDCFFELSTTSAHAGVQDLYHAEWAISNKGVAPHAFVVQVKLLMEEVSGIAT